jgi:hypothetical protein
MLTISANEPSIADAFLTNVHDVVSEMGNPRLRQDRHTKFKSAFREQSMQGSTAHAQGFAMREIRVYRETFVQEAETNEGVCLGGIEIDAQDAQGGDSLGKQTFPAGLIDGERTMIDQRYAEALGTGRDGRCQTGWATADDQYIGIHGRTLLDAPCG